MPETLCIAELDDGRRVLAYVDAQANTGQIVLVLRPEDFEPKGRPYRLQDTHTRTVIKDQAGNPVGIAWSRKPLPIPAPPPAPRITADDLIQRGAQLAPGQPVTPEDQLLKDILDLRDDEPEAPSLP